MRIGYFVARFPYQLWDEKHSERYPYSGIELTAYKLAVNIARRGHEVSVFTTSVDSKDSIEKYENMLIYHYGTNFRMYYRNISFNMLFKPLRYDVDIVHVHSNESILAALLYTKRKKMPLILSYKGDLFGSYGGFIRKTSVYFYNKLINRLLSYADIIISPSEYFIEESRFLRKYKDKAIAIPNGINIKEFDVPYSKEECREKLQLTNKNIVLFVGNIYPYKGTDILVKAMPKIIRKIPDTKLVFVGEGILKESLRVLSIKLSVNKNINFAGFVEKSMTPLYYKAADVFCLPSTGTESFGNVNLEAMVCGVPIVASKIGGIPGVVKDGENGLLVPPRDTNALADAIIYLLENEDVRVKMGRNGRKKVENYSWEKIAEETEKVYLNVIGEDK